MRRGEPAKKLSSLTIFFPFYDEVDHVEGLARLAMEVGQKYTDDLEVLLVDDGSSDGTGELADSLAAKYPDVIRAIHNRPNLGYGGALKRGFESATKDWIFYTDGDGQFDLNDLELVVPWVKEGQIVSPYRMDRQDSALRKLNAAMWGTLVRKLFRLRVRDIDCAFKVYPREFISRVNLKSDGALIDTEMLARAQRLGYPIVQVGVNHYPRKSGESTGGNPAVILRAFRELWTLRKDILRD
ncbi:MAG: glycosyltransferase family 2 protein [Planctomycetes bacterium]|nr:glycosyltransferase family 2 protein [Planctomycetota bacterium]